MKIISIKTYQVEMKLSEPYTIAYETVSSTTNVFIKIETSSGITGFGCAAPDLEVTGETADTVISGCKKFIEPILKGVDPLRYVYQLEKLKEGLKKSPSAMAMVDMALFDIMGKVAGIPLYKMLGGFRDRMKTSVTVGILPLPETIKLAKKFKSKGFKVLKIKGGKDVDEDI